MRIEPTNAHKDTCIYYTIDVVSLLHVSSAYYGQLLRGVLGRIYYKEHENQFTNICYSIKYR